MKLLSLAALSASLLIFPAASQADDWALVRHDAQNSGASAENLKAPLKRAWLKKGATNEPILVAGNTLLYTSRRAAGLRDLQAINATTGAPLWTVKDVTQTGAISVKDGLALTVLRTSDKPTSVSKLGANLWPAAIAGIDLTTGKTLWTYPIGDHPTYPATSPLTVAGHSAYLVNIPYCVPGEACDPGQLIALDSRTGKEVAKYEWTDIWGGQIGVVHGAPLVDAEEKYVTIGLGYRAAPDSYGGQLWVFPTGARMSDGPLHRLGDPDAAGTGEVSSYAHKGGNIWPLLGGGFLAVQGPLETTRVWDVTKFPATLKWEIRFTRDRAHSIMPGGANPMLLEFNSGTKLLTAMYMSSGKNIWSKTMKVTGLSATAGKTVFVPGQTAHPVKAGVGGRSDIQDGILYALDTMTGKALWSIRRPDVTFNAPVPANGRLYLSDSDGNLECYVPTVGK